MVGIMINYWSKKKINVVKWKGNLSQLVPVSSYLYLVNSYLFQSTRNLVNSYLSPLYVIICD